MVPVLKNVEERYTTKNYCTVSQVFEKLVNIRIFDHLEIFCFFLISSMVSGLADLRTVASDGIGRAF